LCVAAERRTGDAAGQTRVPVDVAFAHQRSSGKVRACFRSCLRYLSENIIRDQARRLARADHIPEEFVQTASDIDDISQKYKDEIRNQTVSFIFLLSSIPSSGNIGVAFCRNFNGQDISLSFPSRLSLRNRGPLPAGVGGLLVQGQQVD
jgi:hypothetical protein